MVTKKRNCIFFIVSAVAVITVILLCLGMKESAGIPEKPSDTVLEFWITENVEPVDWTDYDSPYGMFGGEAYLGRDYQMEWIDGEFEVPEEHVIYIATAWPDYADGGKYITEIEITDPAVTVYGLTIASSFEEFDSLFEAQGYELLISEKGGRRQHQATKNGIHFSLTVDTSNEGREKEAIFIISAEVGNRDNIVF